MVAAHSDLGTIAAEWDALAEETGAAPFLRPGWIAAWSDAFGAGRLHVLTSRRAGELRGVLPLHVSRGHVRGAANWHSPEFGAVARDEDAAAELASSLARLRPRRLTLPFLDPDGLTHAAVARALAGTGYRPLVRVLEEQPWVDLAAGREAFEAGLDAKFLRDLRRRRRKLDEAGTVEVDVRDGSERLDALLDEGLRLEPSGWKGRTAIAASPATLAFYRSVCGWAAARGWLRLAFLRVDGRAIAFELALEQRRSWWFLKGGFDRAWHRYAPGRLLVHAMLERAFERRLATFELLGGAEPWKLEWTRALRPRVQLQAFAPSLAGRADWVAHAHVRPAAKRVRVVDRAVLALRR